MTATIEVPPAAEAPSGPPPSRSERHPGRRRPPLPQWRTTTSFVGLSIFLLAGWAVAYVFIFSSIQHARAQHRLYATFRNNAAQGLVPFGGVITDDTPVAVITIPAAHLNNEVVVQGTSSGDLRDGPGHLPTTVLPGQPGVSVLFGRSVAFGGPFGSIDRLVSGNKMTVTTGQGTFTYQVLDVRRPGDALPLLPKGGSRLTLVTSTGSGWRSSWSPSGAVYVDAMLQGDSQPDPGGRPTSAPSADQVMASDTGIGTLMQLVLWLQLLVVCGCLVAWLANIWNRRALWLVSVPILIAVVWGLSNTAVRLLPNLM